jgi:hypothetical protein
VPFSLFDKQKLTARKILVYNFINKNTGPYHKIKITMQETLVTTPTHLLSENDVNKRIR